jgi:hypothetical protein
MEKGVPRKERLQVVETCKELCWRGRVVKTKVFKDAAICLLPVPLQVFTLVVIALIVIALCCCCVATSVPEGFIAPTLEKTSSQKRLNLLNTIPDFAKESNSRVWLQRFVQKAHSLSSLMFSSGSCRLMDRVRSEDVTTIIMSAKTPKHK